MSDAGVVKNSSVSVRHAQVPKPLMEDQDQENGVVYELMKRVRTKSMLAEVQTSEREHVVDAVRASNGSRPRAEENSALDDLIDAPRAAQQTADIFVVDDLEEDVEGDVATDPGAAADNERELDELQDCVRRTREPRYELHAVSKQTSLSNTQQRLRSRNKKLS